ncbi:MAG TPA: hypothetical protein VMU10_00695 [Desulfomonilia bacterium]|nr:hypothetical protein [Desulfomonilia bacterium]
MGVYEPEALEPAGMSPHPVQLGNGYARRIACDHIFYGPRPVDKQPDLDAYFMGKTAELGAKIVSNDNGCGNLPPVQPLDGLFIGGLQGL